MSSIDSGSFEFALRIQNVLSSDDTNLVFSPFSLTSALAITLYGTRGNSGAQLSKVLFGHQIDVNDYQSMVQEFQSLINKCLKSNSKVLISANFIYTHKEYPILPDFSQTIDKYFSAKSQVLDFIDGNAEGCGRLIERQKIDSQKIERRKIERQKVEKQKDRKAKRSNAERSNAKRSNAGSLTLSLPTPSPPTRRSTVTHFTDSQFSNY
jgi:serpin B